jgi:hypothetical protein
MIRLQWTARVSRGKNPMAIQWAKETAAYLRSKYPKILAIAAYEEHFGNLNTIHIFTDYENLATLESVEDEYQSDGTFQALFKRSSEEGLFIEGSMHGTCVKSL